MENYSIITTCYNDAKNICSYLAEMTSQTVQAVEIIVVDGGSKDDTIKVAKEYAEQSIVPIRIVEGKRLNIAQGFNVGIKTCTTELFVITCIGNRFVADMAEQLIRQYETSKADVIYGRLKGVDTSSFSRIYNQTFTGGDKGVAVSSNRCVMLHKNAIKKNGYFIENFVYAGEDSEYYFSRAKKNNLTFSFIDHVLVYWVTPVSLSEFTKKVKDYVIADLQWADVYRQYLCFYAFYTLLLCITCVCLFVNPVYAAIALLVEYIIGLIYASGRVHTVGFVNLHLYLYNILATMYYRIRYCKYSFTRYRVV